MLLKVAPHISECLERAQRSHERAENARDPFLKEDYLDIERTWLRLAESYRTVERMQAFLADAQSKRNTHSADASDAEIDSFPSA